MAVLFNLVSSRAKQLQNSEKSFSVYFLHSTYIRYKRENKDFEPLEEFFLVFLTFLPLKTFMTGHHNLHFAKLSLTTAKFC